MTTHSWLKRVSPLLTADAMQKKSPWSSPLQWQLSSQLPVLSLHHRPLLTDALFPEMLFNCWRMLKVKTLSIPLETVYFERKNDADLGFGEASTCLIPIPTSAQDFRKALVPQFPNLRTSVRAYPISVKCYDDNYSDDSPMIGCCADGKGKARHSSQMCCTTR